MNKKYVWMIVASFFILALFIKSLSGILVVFTLLAGTFLGSVYRKIDYLDDYIVNTTIGLSGVVITAYYSYILFNVAFSKGILVFPVITVCYLLIRTYAKSQTRFKIA